LGCRKLEKILNGRNLDAAHEFYASDFSRTIALSLRCAIL
jgi:hypothetical protein